MADQQKIAINKDLQELRERRLVTNLLRLNRQGFNSNPSGSQHELNECLEQHVPNLIEESNQLVPNTVRNLKTSTGEDDKQAVIEHYIHDCDATINDSSELQNDYSSFDNDGAESFSNFSCDGVFDWNFFFDSSLEFNSPPVTPPNTPNELFNNIIIRLNLNLNITRQ